MWGAVAAVRPSQFATEVVNLLKTLPPVRLSGEVDRVVRSKAGHAYFRLSDAGASVPCVLMRGRAIKLADPPAGATITVVGRLRLYEERGHLQLDVEEIFGFPDRKARG